MKALILAGLLASAGKLYGQSLEPATVAPSYRGFFPGMTVAQFQETAQVLNLAVQCVPVFDAAEVFGLCQTQGARALIESSTAPVNDLAVLAALDEARTVVRYVVVLEPDSTSIPALLRERTQAWGEPQLRESELVGWGRHEYGMAVMLRNSRRTVIVGYTQGPGPGLIGGIGIVDVPPQLGDCSSIVYPPEMKAQGISGKAVIQFIVGTDGAVENRSIKVLETDHVEFGNAATSFLQTCRFSPGLVGQRAVRVLVQQTVNFAIN